MQTKMSPERRGNKFAGTQMESDKKPDQQSHDLSKTQSQAVILSRIYCGNRWELDEISWTLICCLMAPTPDKPLVKVFTPFAWQEIDHLDRHSKYYLPQTTPYTWGNDKLSKHFDPFSFTTWSEDWNLGQNTSRLSSELFTECFHYTLPIGHRQPCSTAKSSHTSALKSHISEFLSSTDLIAAAYTRLLIDSRISRRRQRCLKLITANWTPSISE